MVVTRSGSRNDPLIIVTEKDAKYRTSRVVKKGLKMATAQKSPSVVHKSKQVNVRNMRSATAKNRTAENLQNVRNSKRHSLTTCEIASVVEKKPRLEVRRPMADEVVEKREQKGMNKIVEDVINTVESNTTCHLKVVERSDEITSQCPPVKEDEGAWEDFGNTSEEDNSVAVNPRNKNFKSEGCCGADKALKGPQLRRSVRTVKRRSLIKEDGNGVDSSSSSTMSDDSNDNDHVSCKDSVQSDEDSHGSDTSSSMSYAAHEKMSTRTRNIGRKQVHSEQSKGRKKSNPAVSTDSNGGGSCEFKPTPTTQTRTAAYTSKPPKPWQKVNETVIEGGIVVPPRELRRGEKKMLKFRILAAALAVGRNREMTEDEANQLLYQMRAGTETKRASLLSSMAHTTHSVKGDESSSEDEWEEMELADIGDCKTKDVQVMLEKADEKDWWALYLRQEINKCVRDNWENCHKVNILCYIGHLQYLKKVVLEENFIPSLMLTKMPTGHQNLVGEPMTVENAHRIARWYHSTFKASKNSIKCEAGLCRYDATARYSEMIAQEGFENDADRAALLFALFVSLECSARICVNLLPIPRKWDENVLNEYAKKGESSTLPSVSKQTKQVGKCVSKKKSTAGNDYHGMTRNYWVEYWDVKQKRWICVDPLSAVVGDPDVIEENLIKPILYIIAIDNEGGVREVTSRYASDFSHPDFRRRRTDPKWITDTLNKNYIRANRKRSELEDLEFRQELVKKPLPTTLSAYKNHPLYVLEKDLLKFEGIYPKPEDQKPLGEVRGHKVYPRSTVYTLQSANNWIKMARSVKEGEKPYKVVKARPNLHVPAEEREQRYLDVFGYWQTEPYRPPEVTNGRIPCNEFGNVYMYQPSMCPIGAVHLRLPGLPSIARRLGGLQCVPAVVGWDFNSCSNFPIMEGACVLKEDAEKFINEWKRLETSRKQREKKRREERVLGHWRKLIRGVLRLQYVRSKFGAIKAKAKAKKKNNESREENEQSSCIIDRTVMAPCQIFTHEDLMKL